MYREHTDYNKLKIFRQLMFVEIALLDKVLFAPGETHKFIPHFEVPVTKPCVEIIMKHLLMAPRIS